MQHQTESTRHASLPMSSPSPEPHQPLLPFAPTQSGPSTPSPDSLPSSSDSLNISTPSDSAAAEVIPQLRAHPIRTRAQNNIVQAKIPTDGMVRANGEKCPRKRVPDRAICGYFGLNNVVLSSGPHWVSTKLRDYFGSSTVRWR
ncbi:hypothetical protein F0562_013600 [Nyssa sinensis]|uniref:Uncharacterized protein n=1 Tax=Nyssa sinensis TaxID=561372 RepID=A0A5J4ZNE2_9ASTE|nr:hypothetical protein F0562_013600 [Nyssa sinensis]